MAEIAVREKVKEKFIFGCVYDQDVVLPDLVTGPRGSEAALRLEPGQVLDLENYFSPARLARSMSLKIAKKNGWLVPCESENEKVTFKPRIVQGGEAPLNEFDLKLADELDKEEAEINRLRQGQDPLGARAKRIRAQQVK